MTIKLRHIVYLIFGFFSATGFAKEGMPLDSLVNETKLMIYTKPLEVIKIGDSLYNETTELKSQIAGILLVSDGLISLRNYSQAFEYANIGKDLLANEDNSDLKVKVWSRLSYIYFQLNLYDEALKYLNRAEEENKKLDKESVSHANQGYIYTVRALVYRNQVNCEMAMKYFEQALEVFAKSTEKLSKINSSVVYYNMGSCYLTMSDYEKASKSFDNAFIAANVFKQDNNSLKLFAEKGLANISIAKGEYHEAIEILKMLFTDAELINDKSLLRSISYDLSSSYLELGDWESFKIYSSINQKFDREIIDFKKEATIIALSGLDKSQIINVEKEKEIIQNKMFVSSLLFILISGVFLWVIYKKKSNIKEIYARIFQN